MLCLNTNTEFVQNFLDTTKKFLDSVNLGTIIDDKNPVMENLNTSVSSLVQEITTKTLNKYNVSPNRMTREEKMKIVHELSDQGVLDIKGGVSEIAAQLDLSESTIYRYMNKK
ncbi:MAG: helix-turn-helix domain-containing protein [Lachnospiraceae bacterium]|nr:helix-turn-helix domain-containing protein [Lachnospiraceae bacterium]